MLFRIKSCMRWCQQSTLFPRNITAFEWRVFSFSQRIFVLLIVTVDRRKSGFRAQIVFINYASWLQILIIIIFPAGSWLLPSIHLCPCHPQPPPLQKSVHAWSVFFSWWYDFMVLVPPFEREVFYCVQDSFLDQKTLQTSKKNSTLCHAAAPRFIKSVFTKFWINYFPPFYET